MKWMVCVDHLQTTIEKGYISYVSTRHIWKVVISSIKHPIHSVYTCCRVGVLDVPCVKLI